MAREHLYKAKRKDNGEWVYWDLFGTLKNPNTMKNKSLMVAEWLNRTKVVRQVTSVIFIDIDENTICEYTGKTDKNGTKIFEGDICRFREWSKGDMCWVGEVHYEHQQFVISGSKNKECETPFTLTMSRFISEDIEVIGNKFDKPELLEVQDA